MEDMKSHLQSNQLNHAPDWKKIKEIICGIADSLELVCAMIPPGPIKSIVCSIVGILKLICNSLPG